MCRLITKKSAIIIKKTRGIFIKLYIYTYLLTEYVEMMNYLLKPVRYLPTCFDSSPPFNYVNIYAGVTIKNIIFSMSYLSTYLCNNLLFHYTLLYKTK